MPKILVVDDKSTNRKLLKTVLTKDKDTKDYEVIEAGSGKAALEAVKNDPPDIILLDIMMPEMDGFEVCTELKEDPQYNAIPILFITAMEKVEEKVKGFEVGAADYITKPINQKEVKARVKAHLRIREAEDERLQAESLKTIKDMIVTYNHEMSQPLTAIQGHADLLMSDAEEDDENYDSYKTILEQSERVIKILNKIKSLETAEKIEKKQYIPGSSMIDLDIEEQSGE